MLTEMLFNFSEIDFSNLCVCWLFENMYLCVAQPKYLKFYL